MMHAHITAYYDRLVDQCETLGLVELGQRLQMQRRSYQVLK